MNKLFTTCLLVQNGPQETGLEMTEVTLHPGTPFSVDSGKNILLAGGFTAITPERNFPLSVTLQLNHDLATVTAEELKKIAEAELSRIHRVNYRSYTADADKRVCVISDSTARLTAFIDIYGGLLDIEPLLTKEYHPELPTVTELNLAGHGQGYRLEYQVRSPINFELCNYCGNCGPVCPEQCISEMLFVNYDLCTFCKECEKVCGAKAIDIHSALSKVLDVPAVIILGDLRVDLPSGSENIFYQETLDDYFAALFPCQIDEVVTCDNMLCQFSGNLGRGCDLCLTSCGYGAIVQDSRGVTVDSLKCQECGACIAACPTGALQNARFDDASFVDYFHQVTLPRGGTVVIGETTGLHELWWRQHGARRTDIFFLQYDNIASLSLFHFLFLLSRGAGRIVLFDSAAPQGLPAGPAKSKAGRQRRLANQIVHLLFDREDAVVHSNLQGFDALMAEQPIGSFGRTDEKDTFVNRRQALALSLEALVKTSGREVTIRPEGYIPFATVRCNIDRCTQCMACLNDCRIEAMRADQQQLSLNHLGAMCVGCGLCVHVCPEDALTISPAFTLNGDFFAPVELARAEPMACKSCGKVFGTRKSFERVMAILSQKETVDTSHFEYCDTCRVVKLFESE